MNGRWNRESTSKLNSYVAYDAAILKTNPPFQTDLQHMRTQPCARQKETKQLGLSESKTYEIVIKSLVNKSVPRSRGDDPSFLLVRGSR